MQRPELSALFRFVLATTATTAACGGLVDRPTGSDDSDSHDDGESSSSSSGKSGSSSGGWSSSSSGNTSSGSTSGSSGSSSGGSSSGTSGSTSGGGPGACVTGTIDVTEAFCCPPGETCANAPYGEPDADAGLCAVDCDRVCDAVAPDVYPGGFRNCHWSGAPSTQLSYVCGGCGVGRVAEGTPLHPLGVTLGERLAHQAYYEAASVTAFARLARVLAAAEAPWDLVRRADAAAQEESRHAATFAALAAKHGATACVPEPDDRSPTLFELALENATEGCVRETFGALMTLHQAEHAETAEVRAAFAAIAEDELSHAAFSWDLFAWLDTVLAPKERKSMHDAYELARRAAERDVAQAPSALDAALGLPAAQRAREMFSRLMQGLEALRAA